MNTVTWAIYLGWAWFAPGYCVEQAIVAVPPAYELRVAELARYPCTLREYERRQR